MTHPSFLAAPITGEAVQALTSWSADRGSEAAFQALLAASASAVRSARMAVADVQRASLSLAQARAAEAITDEMQTTAEALESGLSEQGACLLDAKLGPIAALRAQLPALAPWRGRRARLAAPQTRPTWLGATSHAIRTLGETAEHMDALADNQPEPSPSRQLGQELAARLRHHRNGLMAEVARLVD
ncbi:MAG: hypothetical protein Rubg2KO_23060 [Rubricoccaceae bacterium]